MTLADERLRGLDASSLTANERVLLRCATAADLINKGQYEAAREALGELWPGVGERPSVKNLPPATAVEVLLQCGVLTGWLGSVRNLSGAQEEAKDLLSEALREFQTQGRQQKASEAQYELGICYWRLGEHDEARVVLAGALKPLTEADAELKAKILIRRTLVEFSENRYHEALSILKEAEPVFEFVNEALKGRWHGQKALVLDMLATVEGNTSRFDQAIIEYVAAIYHYEQAGHERYCAQNLNNLAMLLYRFGRHNEAHEHLDRAQLIFTKLRDPGNLAQVDETRARVLVAERKYGEADRIISGVIKAFERGGESALLVDALALHGVVRARMGAYENSVGVLRRAIDVGEAVGAMSNAGLAALTLIEEHGAQHMLSEGELYELYRRADALLRGTQDAGDVARLRACARIVMRRLAGAELRDKDFSFYGAVREFEAKLIAAALEKEAGSVTRAAKLLGVRYQTLGAMLEKRHKELLRKRKPVEKRRRSIIKKDA